MIEVLALLFTLCSYPNTECNIQVTPRNSYGEKSIQITVDNICYEITAKPGMHAEEDVYVFPCKKLK